MLKGAAFKRKLRRINSDSACVTPEIIFARYVSCDDSLEAVFVVYAC
jgi:hypothetical protein